MEAWPPLPLAEWRVTYATLHLWNIWPVPVEVPDPVRFTGDRVHASYDRDAAERFCRVLYDRALSEFVVGYEEIRTAPSPRAALLEFMQSTYDAAATLAGWDRAAVER